MSHSIDYTANPPMGPSVIPDAPALPTNNPISLPRKSRWPARLDLLQSLSGLLLALFLIAHMAFVSTILISQAAFYNVARFFEGAWLLGRPYPMLVSLVASAILALLMLHAWLAMRKFPAGFRQYRAFIAHKNRLHHGDTSLWWLQLWTGFLLFFLASIHLYDMLSQPELIGPYASADRVWSGGMWPLYLLLLFSVELHGGIGLYRLLVKWGLFGDKTRARLHLARHAFSAFFITLGLLTLLAYIDLGRSHAAQAGERYIPKAAAQTATH
ncbi:MAG: fumarate reductase cytochrome b subunit [Dechloromonas sp.]|nr:fumarate reductase cytochrome b subunit [Dechloromonas sp.]